MRWCLLSGTVFCESIIINRNSTSNNIDLKLMSDTLMISSIDSSFIYTLTVSRQMCDTVSFKYSAIKDACEDLLKSLTNNSQLSFSSHNFVTHFSPTEDVLVNFDFSLLNNASNISLTKSLLDKNLWLLIYDNKTVCGWVASNASSHIVSNHFGIPTDQALLNPDGWCDLLGRFLGTFEKSMFLEENPDSQKQLLDELLEIKHCLSEKYIDHSRTKIIIDSIDSEIIGFPYHILKEYDLLGKHNYGGLLIKTSNKIPDNQREMIKNLAHRLYDVVFDILFCEYFSEDSFRVFEGNNNLIIYGAFTNLEEAYRLISIEIIELYSNHESFFITFEQINGLAEKHGYDALGYSTFDTLISTKHKQGKWLLL